MRIFTFLTMAAMLTGVLTVKAQEEMVTYTDDFSGEFVYSTLNFKSAENTSIWHGFEVNSGVDPTAQNCTSASVETVDGALVLKSSNGGWEGDHDDGLFLYRNVMSGVDFEVQVKLAGGDFKTFAGSETNYNSAGLLIRNSDHTAQNTIYAMYFDLFNIHSMIKTVTNGEQKELINSMDPKVTPNFAVADYPYIKISRVGVVFTLSVSKDGIDWVATVSCERPDFEGVDLQVGVAQCNFWSGDDVAADYSTSAILDNFKLTHSIEGVPASARKISASNDVKTYFNRNSGNIQIQSNQLTISKINVYSIDGRLVDSAKNLDTNSYNIPVSKSGIYMVSVETNQGVKVSKVSVTR